MDDNTISVLVPCYNAADYLSAALDSALAQTHRPTEIIVVDDGSTDRSAEIVGDYLYRFPDRGIRLIQQANAGESAARNTGIHAATGAWIAMLDADDWWEHNKLALQLAAAKEAGPRCVLVHTGQITHLPNGETNRIDIDNGQKIHGWCTDKLLQPIGIGHSSILVRRDALQCIGGYDSSLKHAVDIDIYFKLSVLGTFAFVPHDLLHYRIHGNQTSWQHKIDQIRDRHKVIRRFFNAHPDLLTEIGEDRIHGGMSKLVHIKLESFYWQRRLKEFRQLLQYAKSQQLDNPDIRLWRRRAAAPDWLIRFKDRLTSHRSPV